MKSSVQVVSYAAWKLQDVTSYSPISSASLPRSLFVYPYLYLTDKEQFFLYSHDLITDWNIVYPLLPTVVHRTFR